MVQSDTAQRRKAAFHNGLSYPPIIMGILNVTPDSFYDGGWHNDINKAVDHALQMIEEGADCIDIGAESTRPGHVPVDTQTEIDRLVPVIEAVRAESDCLISADTSKAAVAEAALEAGGDIINDVQGLQGDLRMADVAALYGAPVIIMHNRTKIDPTIDIIEDMKGFFSASIRLAEKAGVRAENIILDPGIGFGKSLQQNCEAVARLGDLKSLGYPLLMGLSRKSFIGLLYGDKEQDRLVGTVAGNLAAIENGAGIIRVHDVAAHRDALKIWKATRR